MSFRQYAVEGRTIAATWGPNDKVSTLELLRGHKEVGALCVLCAILRKLDTISDHLEGLPQKLHDLTPEGRAETKAKEEAEEEGSRLWGALVRRIREEIGQLALPQRCRSPMFDYFLRENCAPRWQAKPEEEWVFILPAMIGKTPGTKIRASYTEWLAARKEEHVPS